MNEIKLTMTELMKELYSAKEVLIKIGSIKLAEVRAKPRNNGPNANKKKKKVGQKDLPPRKMASPKGNASSVEKRVTDRKTVIS